MNADQWLTVRGKWLLGFGLASLAGCGCQPIAMPIPPPAQTEFGLRCVSSCQKAHADCMQDAVFANAAGVTPYVALINGCRINLGECYPMCPL